MRRAVCKTWVEGSIREWFFKELGDKTSVKWSVENICDSKGFFARLFESDKQVYITQQGLLEEICSPAELIEYAAQHYPKEEDTTCIDTHFTVPQSERFYQRPPFDVPTWTLTTTVPQEDAADNYDEHYAASAVQPGDLRAQLAVQLENIPPDRLVFVLDAVKHIVRAGNKEGEPWEKDLSKAINELTRAVTGEWR